MQKTSGSKITYYMDTSHQFGYGDAIVGIVSTYLLARRLGMRFGIVWSVDITHLFHHVQHGVIANYTALVNPESKQQAVRLLTSLLSRRRDISICTNAPWHSFLYSNAHDLCRDMRDAYRLVYRTLMPPRDGLRSRARELLSTFRGHYIGVAVRCGDYSWQPSCANVYIERSLFPSMAHVIARSLRHVDGSCTNVFLTSDNTAFLEILRRVLMRQGYNVLTTRTKKVHLIDAARKEDTAGISNTVLDHYVLTCCQSFVVTKDVSNFGLTAAMSSGSNNVWSLDTKSMRVRKLKRNLVLDMSKGGLW